MDFRVVDQHEWHDFWVKSPNSTPFTSAWFPHPAGGSILRVIGTDTGKQLIGYAATLSESGRPHAAPFTMYQGLMLTGQTKMTGGALSVTELAWVQGAISDLLERSGRIFLSQHWSFSDPRPLTWFADDLKRSASARISVGTTARLVVEDGTSDEDLMRRIRSTRRREIRQGVANTAVGEEDDIDLLVRMMHQSHERSGNPLTPNLRARIESICEAGLVNRAAKLFVARKQGEPIAAVLVLCDRRFAYYMFAGSSDQGRAVGANSAILWHVISSLREWGLHGLDFVGANSPSRGDFKLSFGADLAPFYTIESEGEL